jgi:cytochrome c-type biogenesis protein
MESFTLELYEILGAINKLVYDPLTVLARSINIPVITALLLGILGSTAPCQITTNFGAVGFIAKDGESKGKLLYNTLLYALGKIVTFSFYGVIIVIFNIQFQKTAIPMFTIARKIIGPIVIWVGLYVLGIVKLKGSIGDGILSRTSYYISKFKLLPSAFVMGVIFSLAFCPTLLWLFVGGVVPLSIKSPYGLMLPVVFAVGTLVPMIIMITLIALGKGIPKERLKAFKNRQGLVRTIGGIFLVMLGIFDTIIYWML